MKNIFTILSLSLAITLSSCSVMTQTYEFAHHGTDSIKANSNFKYIAKNVLGKAKTTLKMSAWKRLKQEMATNGLLSEAKGNLPALKDNQAYANLSIDQLTTTKGKAAGQAVNVTEITIEIVVSADIIEYEK